MTELAIVEHAAPVLDTGDPTFDELGDDGPGDKKWWWTDHKLANEDLEIPIDKDAAAIAEEVGRLRRDGVLPWGHVSTNDGCRWAQFLAVDPPGFVSVEINTRRADGRAWALQVRRAADQDGDIERVTLPEGARRTHAHPATAGIVPVADSARLTVAEAAAVAAAHLLGEPLSPAWRALEIPWRVR